MYHPQFAGPAEAVVSQPSAAPPPTPLPGTSPGPDTGPDADIEAELDPDLTPAAGQAPGMAGPWPLPRSREACSMARRAVRHTLFSWGLGPLADTAELLVSELVANALLHAEGPVHLTLLRGRGVCCQVGDGSRDLPRVQHAAAEDEFGRGMSMVDLLACDWGAERTAWGKTVWFELPLAAPPEGPDHA